MPDIADVPGSGVDPADLKFYFAARDHELVRSVEAALTHEGLPARYYTEPATYPRDNFAEYGMDDEADALAEEYTRKYAEEMGLQRAQEVTREVIEDLANDELESVVAVDRDTGEIIFVRYGDEVSVNLQEEQRKLAEGRNIVLIHNHPGNGAASRADLGAADWLDAERLVVVTPSGERYYYHRRGGKLVGLEPVQGSGVAAESDPVETAVARLLHMMQSAREAGNPAERVMRQEEPGFRDRLVNTAQKLNLISNPTDRSVTELLEAILTLKESDMGALHEAAAIFFGEDMQHHDFTLRVMKDFPEALAIRETAERTDIDPALIGMVLRWEDASRSWNPLETWNFDTAYDSPLVTSYGPAQIQVPTATEMLAKHSERFDGFEDLIDGMRDAEGNWIPREVGRQLFESQEFAIRVAGVYLEHIHEYLVKSLDEYGVAISDENNVEPHITTHQLWMMTAVGYNQGLGGAIARLENRYNIGGSENVVEGVEATLGEHGSPYDDDVLGKRGEVLEHYGLFYRWDQNQE
ncbi:MAG: hypothetical protein OXG39_14040 [Chloroflexi bacterium]|nr:hypothetical protein [Chloroflexota bacterium]